MERREKIEQAVKERERSRLENIQKKWTRREENEFLRVLTGYGVDLQPLAPVSTPDWTRFKAMAKLDKKSDEALSDYYKVFIAMCKRQAGARLNDDEKGLEGLIEDISEDHARLVLDRLELLSKLKEVAKNQAIDERLIRCQNNFDTPDWWESGKHDKELIKAVLKHGLYHSEHNIYNNPEYSFMQAMRSYASQLEDKFMAAKMAEAAETEVKDIPIMKKEQCDEAEPSASAENAVKEELPQVDNTEVIVKPDPEVEAEAEVVAEIEPKQVDELAEEKPKELTALPSTEEITSPKPDEESAESSAEQPDEQAGSEEASSVQQDASISTADDSVLSPKQIEQPDEAETASATVEAIEEDKPKDTDNNVQADEAPVAEAEAMEVDDDNKLADKDEPSSTEAEDKEKEADEPITTTDTEEDKEKKPEEAKEDEPVVPESNVSDEAITDPEPSKETNGMDVDNEETEAADIAKIDVNETASEETDKSDDDKPKIVVEEKMETVEPTDEKSGIENEEKADEPATAEKPETAIEKSPESPAKLIDDESIKVEEVEKEPTPASPVPSTAETPSEKSPAKVIDDEDDDVMVVGKGDPDDDEVMKEKEIAVEEECKKQAADLKARFPDLEVIQPLLKVKSSEQIAEIKEKYLAAYENPIKLYWFRDFALEKRISHIIYCIEHLEWPINKSFSAYTGCQGMNLDVPLYETVKHMGSPMDSLSRRSSTPDVITITTDQGLAKQLQSQLPSATTLSQIPPVTSGKKRKRHIAIDVETERAKLHALLNSSQGPGTPTAQQQTPPPSKQSQSWPDDEATETRGGSKMPAWRRHDNTMTPPRDDTTSPPPPPPPRRGGSSSMQPPPAHQHHSMSRSSNNQQQQATNFSTKPTVIPGTSSTLTPIDLTSR